MELNEEQQFIVDQIKDNKNVIVDAVAGTGKTTTILSLAEQLPKKSMLQITYNKSLKHEVREKIKAREIKRITKVDELVSIIEKSKKRNFSKKINPSTKTFQALRIFVNKEISELLNGMINATKMLKPGGKILIISFHSIEDKIVKYFFSTFSKNQPGSSRYLPETKNNKLFLFEKYNKKVIKPSQNEININKSSRSAKLRFAIRSKNQFYFPSNLIEKFKRYLNLEAINV